MGVTTVMLVMKRMAKPIPQAKRSSRYTFTRPRLSTIARFLEGEVNYPELFNALLKAQLPAGG
jgi:hypothetical protein